MGDSFTWDHPGLNWSHFHSLANLLSLRNGGQAEPLSSYDTTLDEDWDPDDEGDRGAPSVDTRLAQKLSDSGHGKLKRRFLDCIAGFAANKKGGTAVACSAMEEAEDSIVIWIARNEGFSDADRPVFDKLGEVLSLFSCSNADRSGDLLWEEMLLYHRGRIERSYIPDLRASFKAYDAACNETASRERSSVCDAALSELRTPLFDCNINDTNAHQKNSTLIIASYNLRREKPIEEALNSSPNATTKSKSLWWSICLISRLRIAFLVFKDIALTLPSFSKVTIILVPRASITQPSGQQPPDLKQTFSMLNLNLDQATSKAILGQNWLVSKATSEFSKRQKQKPNVHAEVQMLMFLYTHVSISGVFPYLGCSKLSCFMCDRFIRACGRFTTKGCHGRLFKPWTVPKIDNLQPGHADRVAKALISVQKHVKKTLKTSGKGHIQHERTSIIGGSSVLTGIQKERSERQSMIDRLNMNTERDRVAEMFRRRAENTINSATETQPKPTESKLDGECDMCFKPTTRRCSMCSKGFYCSDSCEKKIFGRHLFTCSKRPLTSADYLWESLSKDLLPEDNQVLEDFGFNATFGWDMSNLLGVYQGLYLSGKFTAEDIHEWRVGGKLVDKIKEYYFSMDEDIRGRYFPWFLKNLHLWERPKTKGEAEQELLGRLFDKAKLYLDLDDRNKALDDLKPEAKRASYWLLAGMLHGVSPHATETNFYSFGFVTCRGRHEESRLVQIYKLLLTESDGSSFYEFYNQRREDTEPVPFAQFWQAYEAGKLIQLMDFKGLKHLRTGLPFLEDFLSIPPAGPHPSVWDLRQFLEIGDPMNFPPIPSVSVDYGFRNCKTAEETFILMKIYEEILKKVHPLLLHLACVTGKLFELASEHVRMEESWKSLMLNPYPLEGVVEESWRSLMENLQPLESVVEQDTEHQDQDPSPEAGSKANNGATSLLSLVSRLVGSFGKFFV